MCCAARWPIILHNRTFFLVFKNYSHVSANSGVLLNPSTSPVHVYTRPHRVVADIIQGCTARLQFAWPVRRSQSRMSSSFLPTTPTGRTPEFFFVALCVLTESKHRGRPPARRKGVFGEWISFYTHTMSCGGLAWEVAARLLQTFEKLNSNNTILSEIDQGRELAAAGDGRTSRQRLTTSQTVIRSSSSHVRISKIILLRTLGKY